MVVAVVAQASEFPNDNPALHKGTRWVCLTPTAAPTPSTSHDFSRTQDEEIARAAVVRDGVVGDVALGLAEVAGAERRDGDDDGREVAPARISGFVAVGMNDDVDDEEEIVVEEIEPLDGLAVVEGAAIAERTAESAPVHAETRSALNHVSGDSSSTALPPPPPDDAFTSFVCALADVAIGCGASDAAAMLPPLLLDGVLAAGVNGDAAQALAQAGIAQDGALTGAFRAQIDAWRAILRGTSDDFGACGGAMLDEWAADLIACLLGSRGKATALRRELRARGVAAFGLVEAA